MSADLLKAIIETLKLAPRYLAVLGIGAGFMVFAPGWVLQRLGVFELAEHNRASLGAVVVGTGALVIVWAAGQAVEWFRRRSVKLRQRDRIRAYLENLTEHEAAVLRMYVGPQTRSVLLSPSNGVVQGLVHAGILYRAAPIGWLHEGIAYNLTTEAWEYFEENQWFRTDAGLG